jgi:hypothetical protein
MSGTKFTTSIGSNAEQNSVQKTRQAEEEEEEQQPEQEQEQNKGEENVHDEVPYQLWSLGLEAGLEPNKVKVWMTPTSLNLMHPMT